MRPKKILLLLARRRETELRASGHSFIIGVDEAGRGPLAGPVVAGAIALPAVCDEKCFAKLNDSKQLNEATREELFALLTREFPFGVGVVDAPTIDQINIRQASWLAMQRAVANLIERAASTCKPDYVLIDGLEYGVGPWPYEGMVKGDAQEICIAAASIVAKVWRDRLMVEYDAQFPEYGFARHKGYGTAQHLRALQAAGVCEIHRKTFAPVRAVSKQPDVRGNSEL